MAALVAGTGCVHLLPQQTGERRRVCAFDAGVRVCFRSEAERDAWRQQVARERESERLAEKQAIERLRAEDERRFQEAKAKRERAKRAEERKAMELQEQGEAKRQQEKAECRARLLRLRSLAAQREYAVAVTSAAICELREDIREAQAELAREQRLTARSGVTNLLVRREVAEQIDSSEEAIRDLRTGLQKNHRSQPKPCAAVKGMLECADLSTCTMAEDMLRNCRASDECSEDVREFVNVWFAASDVVDNPSLAADQSRVDQVCGR